MLEYPLAPPKSDDHEQGFSLVVVLAGQSAQMKLQVEEERD